MHEERETAAYADAHEGGVLRSTPDAQVEAVVRRQMVLMGGATLLGAVIGSEWAASRPAAPVPSTPTRRPAARAFRWDEKHVDSIDRFDALKLR